MGTIETIGKIQDLKLAESKLKDERKKLESELIDFLGPFKGLSKVFEIDDQKLTVKKSEIYKFTKDYESIRSEIPENLRPERIEYKVVKKGLDYIKENNPEIAQKLSKCIDYKEGAVSITFK